MTDLLLRLWGVIRKEIIELIRQPGLIVALVVGPLLILTVFGSGVRQVDPEISAVFVIPEDNPQMREVVQEFTDAQADRLAVGELRTDEAEAVRELLLDEIQMVVIAPDDPVATLETGEPARIRVLHNFIDPLEAQAVRLFTRTAVDELNAMVVEYAVEQSQDLAAETLEEVEESEVLTEGIEQVDDGAPEEVRLEGLERLIEMDPRVFARPFVADLDSVAGDVSTSSFYAPAVVALILQHLTITFVALSAVREEELGMGELLAVSPLRGTEAAAGKVIAYLIVGGVLAAAVIGVFVGALGVPARDGLLPVAGVLTVETLASIGLGFLLAALARNTTQVVQGGMLLLLGSVFFGGLLLSAERLQPWARPVGWGLPMTHAIPLLRDSMLRGAPLDDQLLVVLGLMAIGFTVAGVVLLERRRRVL